MSTDRINDNSFFNQFITEFAKKNNLTEDDISLFVKEFFTLISEVVQLEKYINIKGLGTFKLILEDDGTGQAKERVSFTPDEKLSGQINKPFSYFETVVLNDEAVFDEVVGVSTPSPLEKSEDHVEHEEKAVSVADSKEENAELSHHDESEEKEDNRTEDDSIEEEPNTQDESEFIETSLPGIHVEDLPETVEEEVDPFIPEVILDPEAVPDKKEKTKSLYTLLIAIIVGVLVGCGSLILYLYIPDLVSKKARRSIDKTEELIDEMPVEEDGELFIDSIEIEPVDSIAQEIDTLETVAPKRIIRAAKQTIENKEDVDNRAELKAKIKTKEVKANNQVIDNSPKELIYDPSLTYKTTGTRATHRVQSGETLMSIAEKFYKSKKFWKYIVEYNQDVIPNPDNVQSGTLLKIPNLELK